MFKVLSVFYHIKSLLFLLISLLSIGHLSGAHLIGGTMEYECLGNNSYRVTLTIYKDCNSSTPFDPTASIGFFNASGSLIYNYDADAIITASVPVELNNPCLTSPPNVCVEKTEYELIVDLPPIVGGYDIVYQRCCRNASAINIISPSSMGSTYQAHIPESSIAPCNNTPVFNNTPPTIMCTGYAFDYDLSATDADGDSLYYFFGNPLNGGSSNNPAPAPPSAPPYSNIPWNTGYSSNYQIDAFPQFTLDPYTGALSGTPTNSGFYTFCINIKEYRNGVLINEIYRDFLLIITNCETTTQAEFSDEINSSGQNNFCNGTTINFVNNSTNASLYFWDFGDPSTTNDTSSLHSPTYVYPDTGIYTVLLVTNPGFDCADSVFHQFEIYSPLNASFVSQNDQCFLSNSYNLQALGNFNQNAIITWDFGNSTTASNSTGPNTQVSFVDTGDQTIGLTIENNGCTINYTETVYIYPNPIANFPAQNIFCDGSLSLQLQNNSTNASSYYWDFGDLTTTSDTSVLFTPPIYIYPEIGAYTITLIANQHNLCFDTVFQTYNLYPYLIGSYDKQATQCFKDNLFSLNAIGNYSSNALFNWDFGSSATVSNANTDTPQVHFLDTGEYIVTLTIQDYGCTNTYSDTLSVLPNAIANFSLNPTNGCQPLTVNFYDSSSAAAPIFYLWDFGDGNTSTTNSPSYTYSSAGTFDVSLTISTTEGCIEEIKVLLDDTIHVHPKPEAKFKVDPTESYFYNNMIAVENLSNAFYQEFNMGDGSIFNTEYIEYSYLDTGHFILSQFVSTEFGCTDSLQKVIWIKPDFSMFVPNAFTPDGDYLNDIFLPQLNGVIEYELKLFNRWGEMIFRTDELTNGWDGTYKNSICPVDVYVWKIKARTVDHLLHNETGQVNLIR